LRDFPASECNARRQELEERFRRIESAFPNQTSSISSRADSNSSASLRKESSAGEQRKDRESMHKPT
jgi:hypothetical protein